MYSGDASGVLDCPNFISHKGLEGTAARLPPFRFVGITFGIIPLRACSKEEKYDEPKDRFRVVHGRMNYYLWGR